jgi:hypothetical protein
LSALMVVLVVPNVSVFAAPARAGQPTGVVSGAARSADGPTLPGITVRLRNVESGQLFGETTSAADGQFSFASIVPGNYVVELVNASGEVLGASAPISLSEAAMTVSGLTVRSFALGAANRGGGFLLSTWGIVTIAAIGAGVLGIVVATNKDDASPAK